MFWGVGTERAAVGEPVAANGRVSGCPGSGSFATSPEAGATQDIGSGTGEELIVA